ncbi:hypothetical protein BDF19DRAFT_496803 [Syncephalis fuscata]|nr:hypothetical protein BDF19DRAFT_496803 [Syncephalis fuscata]
MKHFQFGTISLTMTLLISAMLLPQHTNAMEQIPDVPRSLPNKQRLKPSQSENTRYLNREFSGSINFPRPLSPLAKKVYDDIMKHAKQHPDTLTTPPEYIATAGRVKKTSVGYSPMDDVCRDIYADTIKKAKKEVVIQTYFYDPKSSCAKEISRAIRYINDNADKDLPPIEFYLLIDTTTFNTFFPSLDMSKVKKGNMLNGVHSLDPDVLRLPPKQRIPNVNLKVFNFHNWPMGSIHSKNIAVDGTWSCIGSKNVDSEAALELGIQLEGPVSTAIRMDFFRLLGIDPPKLNHPVPVKAMDMVPMIVTASSPYSGIGKLNRSTPQSIAWTTSLTNARESVYILTPNFNTKVGRYALVKALENGAKVDLITSYKMLDFGQGLTWAIGSDGTNENAARLLKKSIANNPLLQSRLDHCWFTYFKESPKLAKHPKNGSHVKFMFVDNRIIIGSGNMDTQSWYYSQEFNLFIDDELLAMHLKRKIQSYQSKMSDCFKP